LFAISDGVFTIANTSFFVSLHMVAPVFARTNTGVRLTLLKSRLARLAHV